MKNKLFPAPELGVHSWLFGRARYLRDEGLEQTAALDELRRHVVASTFRSGRAVDEREIIDAVAAVYCSAPVLRAATIADYDHVTGWPAEMMTPRGGINRARLNYILAAAGDFGLVDLWEQSPARPPDIRAPRWALTQLFSESDLICCGRSNDNFTAKSLHDWADDELLTHQLIMPNPSRKLIGNTKAGVESAHCRDAVGLRRYIVVESDAGFDVDQQVKVLEHLRTRSKARLAAVVLSGGKSVHGWFRCDNVPNSHLYLWFQYAISLGADPRLWLPEQFVRLPDGLRDNGARQNLIYLNPAI
jgi:hypothetical protein